MLEIVSRTVIEEAQEKLDTEIRFNVLRWQNKIKGDEWCNIQLQVAWKILKIIDLVFMSYL